MGVKSALIGNSFIDSSSDLSLTGLSEFIYGVHFTSDKILLLTVSVPKSV